MAISGVPEADTVARERRLPLLLGAFGFAALAATVLAWSKWLPYLDRVQATAAGGAYPGGDILAAAGETRDAPSLSGAWAFTTDYGLAVWPALVAALAIAAAVEALLPRRRLLAVFGHDGARGRVPAALAAMPSMMCTCCTAPVVRTLRRSGAPTDATLAYWLANPVLNPAVLVFLALVLPWEWVATRLLVGGLLVVAGTGLVVRAAGRKGAAVPPQAPPVAAAEWRPAPRRLVTALVRTAVVLVPEYLVAVFAVGLLRGWLLPAGGAAAEPAVLATVLAAIGGTLLVIPTAGEIPLILGLAAAGLGKGPLGALLLTLPAISLPSMLMVGRALSWRVTVATAAAVAAAGMLGGALLTALAA